MQKAEITQQLCKHYEEAISINLPNPHNMHTQHLALGK